MYVILVGQGGSIISYYKCASTTLIPNMQKVFGPAKSLSRYGPLKYSTDPQGLCFRLISYCQTTFILSFFNQVSILKR